MNVNLYGAHGKWLMVDLGMTFAGNEYPGSELVFADLAFIEERREDLVGIVLTHAHEDHIGAVPYFAADLDVPLYATPFTAKLVASKLAEAGIDRDVELNVIDHFDQFELGPFGIRYVPLAHSIAEGHALLIDTPYGRVFHTGDWKLDDEPIIGTPATPEQLTAIGDEGVLALVCDSTNVFNPSPSGSEGEVARAMKEEVARHKGKRVLVTTFASNVARLHTLGEVAKATNRRLCVSGRSLDRIIQAAEGCGYLGKLPDIIDPDTAMSLPRGEVLIVATGGQGEPRAALARIAEGTIRSNWNRATLSFSPAVRSPAMKSPSGAFRTSWRGWDYRCHRPSGRYPRFGPPRSPGTGGDLWLAAAQDPDARAWRNAPHARTGQGGQGKRYSDQVVQKNGDLVRLAPGRPGKFAEVPHGRLVLDGDIIAPADGEAVVMRRRLAWHGVLMVAVSGRMKHHEYACQVAGLGLPLVEDYDAFVEEAQNDVIEALGKLRGPDKRNASAISEAARLAVRRAATRWCGKKPQVKVMLMVEGLEG
jgi:ribonuclease J